MRHLTSLFIDGGDAVFLQKPKLILITWFLVTPLYLTIICNDMPVSILHLDVSTYRINRYSCRHRALSKTSIELHQLLRANKWKCYCDCWELLSNQVYTTVVIQRLYTSVTSLRFCLKVKILSQEGMNNLIANKTNSPVYKNVFFVSFCFLFINQLVLQFRITLFHIFFTKNWYSDLPCSDFVCFKFIIFF